MLDADNFADLSEEFGHVRDFTTRSGFIEYMFARIAVSERRAVATRS